MSCIFINLWTETVIRSNGRNMLWYLIAKGRQSRDGGIDCESRDHPFTAIKVHSGAKMVSEAITFKCTATYWCKFSRWMLHITIYAKRISEAYFDQDITFKIGCGCICICSSIWVLVVCMDATGMQLLGYVGKALQVAMWVMEINLLKC